MTDTLAKPRRRERSSEVVALYHEIRRGLACEWCRRGTSRAEVNHILHGQRKEDALWNIVRICPECHQHPRTGFHGSDPEWTVERALLRKLEEGYVLPREAYEYLSLEWPGTVLDPGHSMAVAMKFAARDRRMQ